MAVKIRNTQNGRVATVTDTLGRALVKMGRHEYVMADISQEEFEQEPVAEVLEEPQQETKKYRTRRMKAQD